MDKYHLQELLTAKNITIDELASESNISKDTIKWLLSDEEATLTWHQAMHLSDTVDKLIKQKRARPNSHLPDKGPKVIESLEDQLAQSKARILRLKDLSIKLRSENINELENHFIYKGGQQLATLFLTIDKGSTPDEEIAELLSEISVLYRIMSGSGINFEIQGIDTLQVSTYA